MAYRIGLSPRSGISYTLLRGLERVRLEPVKTVPQVGLSPSFCVCTGGNSENGAGNIFPALYKECSQIIESLNYAWQPFSHMSQILFLSKAVGHEERCKKYFCACVYNAENYHVNLDKTLYGALWTWNNLVSQNP